MKHWHNKEQCQIELNIYFSKFHEKQHWLILRNLKVADVVFFCQHFCDDFKIIVCLFVSIYSSLIQTSQQNQRQPQMYKNLQTLSPKCKIVFTISFDWNLEKIC